MNVKNIHKIYFFTVKIDEIVGILLQYFYYQLN